MRQYFLYKNVFAGFRGAVVQFEKVKHNIPKKIALHIHLCS